MSFGHWLERFRSRFSGDEQANTPPQKKRRPKKRRRPRHTLTRGADTEALESRVLLAAFWQDDFEMTTPELAASGSNRNAKGHASTTDGQTGIGDYSVRGIPGASGDFGQAFTGHSGSLVWRFEDMDGLPLSNPGEIEWTGVDISGRSNLIFAGLFGARFGGFLEAGDFMTVAVNVDGGGYTDILDFQHNGGNVEETVSGTDLTTAMAEYTASISAGNSLDLRVRFFSDGGGDEMAFDNFRIGDNNDASLITGPEISVTGDGMNIADGDGSPTSADDTDFGTAEVTGEFVEHTFTINNTGGTTLNLDGSPIVEITGTGASHFSVTDQPAATVTDGGSDTFTIRFDPSAIGTHTATVTIDNDDSDEDPFNFDITGEGLVDTTIFWQDDFQGVSPELPAGGSNRNAVGHSSTTDGQVFDVGGDYSLRTAQTAAGANDGGATPIAGSIGAGEDFTNASGSHIWRVEDIDTHVGANAQMDWTGIDITGITDLKLEGLFGARFGGFFGAGDGFITVQTQIDSGGYTTILDFQPSAGNLVGSGETLTLALTEFEAPIAGTGDDLDVRVLFDSHGGGDELAFDNLRVRGVVPMVPEINVSGDGMNINDGDTSPQAADDTDFGQAQIGGQTQVHTFTITNTGNAALDLTGSPLVDITGAGSSHFSVSAQPSTDPVPASGGTTTFEITFDPSAIGTHTATVEIANDDSDENPFNFDITGEGIADAPEIAVSGLGVEISDGDTTPSTTDDTDFGDVNVTGGTNSNIFTVTNTGFALLSLDNGGPQVVISGTHASDFTVTADAATLVATNGATTTFTVEFDPSSTGLRTATVTIQNNDADEDPYTFDIQGFGRDTPFWTDDFESTAPSEGVRNLPNHAGMPNDTDGTDYGSDDHFVRTNDPSLGGSATFTGVSGFYWAAQDIDAGGSGFDSDTINWTGITITGRENLVFTGLFGAEMIAQHEGTDQVSILADIDGGGFNEVLRFAENGSGFMAVDTDFDGTGDGAVLSTALQEFKAPISGAGNSLSLRLIATQISGEEEFAWDNFNVEGTQTFTPSDVSVDGGGNLVIDDADGDVDDDLTIRIDGGNYRISDAGTVLAPGSGASMDGGDVLVPVASVTGNILVTTRGGDDVLTVDFSGGNFGDLIMYDGGMNGGTGDVINVQGGGTFADLTLGFVNENDGTIDVTGNQTITYTGLEPITSTITSTNVTLNYSATAETITVSDAGGGQTTVDSTAGELVTFNNPTGTLQINAGDTGVNTVDVGALAASYPANIDINGGNGGDTVNLNGAITFAADRSLTVDSQTINAPNAASDIATSGTGSIGLTATRNIQLDSGSSLSTVNGGVTLDANASGSTTGNFIGLDLDNATVQTTGTGNISLSGKGADNGNMDSAQRGVSLFFTQVSSTATGTFAGTVSINGTGGDGDHDNDGVYIKNGFLTSSHGSIEITGSGGNGSGDRNYGVLIEGMTVSSTGTGAEAATITIDGTGGNGFKSNNGVVFNFNGGVVSNSGDILITGRGGNGSSSQNHGVSFISGGVASTGAGADAATIAINGTGGDGTELNFGIRLTGSEVTSLDGDLQITATGGNGTGNFNNGISIGDNATVRVTDASLEVTGTGGAGDSLGVRHGLSSLGQFLSVGSGAITITADGNGSAADFSGRSDSRIGFDGMNATTGDITINADSIAWTGTYNVQSAGALIIQPRTAGTDINLGTGATDSGLQLNETELAFLQDGFSSITIGDATSGTGTVDVNAATFNDDVTIVGGSISVTELNTQMSNATLSARNGAITDGGDAGVDITGSSLVALSVTGVGTSLSALETAVMNLEAVGGSGGVNVANSGDLTIGGIGATTGVSATGGNVSVSASSPLTVDEDVTSFGDITLTATDSVSTGDDLHVFDGVTVQSTGGGITLNAGDDFTVGSGTTLDAASTITINIDAGDLDGGTGASAILGGTVMSGEGTMVNGNGDADTIDASAISAAVTINGGGGNDSLTGSTAADQINGGAGNDELVGGQGNDNINGGDDDDLITWNNGDGSDNSRGDAGDDRQVVNGADNAAEGDDITVSIVADNLEITRAAGAMLGGFTIDVEQIETIDVNSQDGDDTLTVEDLNGARDLTQVNLSGGNGTDTFDIEPSDAVSVDVVGGDPTMSPGDSLIIRQPSGASSTVTPSGPDSGTVTTTGHQDVTFDEIEDVTADAPGGNDTLTVTGTGEDDLAEVTYSGADAGTLELTTDVDGMPGPTDMFTIMFSGMENLVFEGTGGDDVLRVNDPAAGSNNVTFTGGAGDDTIEILGGTATTVTHNFTNMTDGSITTDATTINYTGLEPILDTITATDRTFTFGATDDDITLADLGGGMSRISSVSSSETVDFTNPTGSLTVNAGDGADNVDASALAVGVTVNGGAGNDALTGTSLADALNGDAGNDEITGGQGDDVLSGGDNDDLIIWNNGDGSDQIDGDGGNDTVEVNAADNAAEGDVIAVSDGGSGRTDLTRTAGTMLGGFTLDIGTVETLDINTLAGEDNVTVTDLSGVSDLSTINGDLGDGNDMADLRGLAGGPVVVGVGGMGDDTIMVGTGPEGGDGGADALNLGLNPTPMMVEYSVNAIPVLRFVDDPGTDTLQIDGSADDDTLTIDFTGITPLADGGTIFNGGGQVSGDAMNLINGTVTSVIHNFTNANDGTVVIDDGSETNTVTYNGLEPIMDTLVAGDRTFNFGATDDDITLSDLGGGMSRIASVSSSETVDFTNPSSSLTINAGDGNDTLDASASAVGATVNGGLGDDELTGSPVVDQINGDAGNDQIIGGPGNDVLSGGDNDDLITWNNGDGSDMIDGDNGDDRVEVNGANDMSEGDVITISDGGSSRTDLTRAAGMTLGGFTLDIGTTETLDVNTQDGDDTINVQAVLTGTATNIDAGAGDNGQPLGDTINVGNAGNTLDEILGDLTIAGGDNPASPSTILGLNVLPLGDTLNINDSGNTSASTVDVTATTITRTGIPQITYGTIESLVVNSGSAADTVNVTDTPDATNVTINTSAGADTVTVTDTGNTNSLQVNTAGGNDSVTIQDVGTGSATRVTAGSGNDTVDASAMTDDITIIGSGGNDFLQSGGGDDDISGGNDNDVILGGAGNDMLAGNSGDDQIGGGIGADNVTGNAGNDLLIGGEANRVVNLNTNFGTIQIELFLDIEPNTAGTFLTNVLENDYIDSIFHRLNPTFVIQGGGFRTDSTTFNVMTTNITGFAANANLANEGVTVSNTRGTVSTALQAGNPNSFSGQFFVSYGDNSGLDAMNHIVFGRVIDMQVVDAIRDTHSPFDVTAETGNGALGELPLSDTPASGMGELVVIESITFGDLVGATALSGVDGIDNVDGGSGDDRVVWNDGAGADNLDGGADTDTLVGRTGTQLSIDDSTISDGNATAMHTNFERADLAAQEENDGVAIDASSYSNATTITGAEGDDTIDGGSAADEIHGRGGNDMITAGAGDDMVIGGDGNDDIRGGGDNDALFGAAGADMVDGGDGDDLVHGGGTSGDVLTGGRGDDIFTGRGFNEIFETADQNLFLADGMMTGLGNDIILGNYRAVTLNGAATGGVLEARNWSQTGVTMNGGASSDTLIGSEQGDLLNGGGGDDRMIGRGGDDTMNGGDGADFLSAQDGNDRVFGDAGNDLVHGGQGTDSLAGGLDDDTLQGAGSNVQMERVSTPGGNLTIVGSQVTGFGSDTIQTALTHVQLEGDDMANVIDTTGTTRRVRSILGGGDDMLIAGNSRNSAFGGDGNDTLIGGLRYDTLHGEGGDDALFGGGNHDVLFGGAGNDVIGGAAGRDIIGGGAGDDMITGGEDEDVILGNDGNDTVIGGLQRDVAQGGDGDDVVIGDTGLGVDPSFDTLAGGAGTNTFNPLEDGTAQIDENFSVNLNQIIADSEIHSQFNP